MNAEDAKRLDRIRLAVCRRQYPSLGDVAFLLGELDAALLVLHDLKEETGYGRGYADGVRAEREKLRAAVFPNPDLSDTERESLRAALRRLMQGSPAPEWIVLPRPLTVSPDAPPR